MARDWGPERPGSGLGVRMPPSLGSSSVGCLGWGLRTGASAPGGGLQPPPGTRGSWTKATDCPQGPGLLNCWLRFLPSPSRAYLNGVKVRSPWWEEVKRLNEGLRTGFWNGRGVWHWPVSQLSGDRCGPSPCPPPGRPSPPAMFPCPFLSGPQQGSETQMHLWVTSKGAGTAWAGRPRILHLKLWEVPGQTRPLLKPCFPRPHSYQPWVGTEEGRAVTSIPPSPAHPPPSPLPFSLL